MILNKPNLGALRLADFAMAAYLVAVFGERFPRLLTWRPFAFLGQDSLVVVAAQSVLAMILVQFSWLFATTSRDRLTTAGAVAFLFLAAWLHQRLSKPSALSTRQEPGLRLSRPHDVSAV